jgi:hypothetical protein
VLIAPVIIRGAGWINLLREGKMRIEPIKTYVDTVPQICKECDYATRIVGQPDGGHLSRHCQALKEEPEISIKNYYNARPFWCPLEKKEDSHD